MRESESKFEKAYIRIPAEAGRKEEVIKVLYNPEQYTIEKSNQFQNVAIPGLALPIAQFISGNADTLTMDLFFDTYHSDAVEKKDVREFTNKIARLLDVDKSLHAPPVCEFIWGEHPKSNEKAGFKAIIERLTQKFTMFTAGGTPVRATLTVVFKEYKTIEEQLREVNRQSADRTTQLVFKDGDSLWLFSAQEYGDSGLWRRIAEENNIDNPRLITPGRELIIPPLE